MTQSFQAKRYKQLVVELGKDHAYQRGWKARVAEKLGVSASYVSKTLANDINDVSANTIKKAIRAVGLDGSFFFDTNERALAVPHTEYLSAKLKKQKERGEPPMTALAISPPRLRNSENAMAAEWANIGDLVGALMLSISVRPTDDPEHVQTTVGLNEAKKLARAFLTLPACQFAIRIVRDGEKMSDAQLAWAALAMLGNVSLMYKYVTDGIVRSEAMDVDGGAETEAEKAVLSIVTSKDPDSPFK